KRLGNLVRDSQGFLGWDGSPRNPCCQRFTFDELHDEEVRFARLLESVKRCDIGMIERGEDLCFAFETRNPFRIFRERLRQDLHGHTPSKPYIPGLIHLAHSARAQAALDFVLPEFVADHLDAILVQEPATLGIYSVPTRT